MSERGQRPSRFLFINKSATAPSLSNNRENRSPAIGRHVQQWRREQRLNELRQGLGRASSSLRPFLVRPSSTMMHSHDDDRGPETKPASVASDPPAAPGGLSSRNPPRNEIPQANFQAGACIDPFDCIPIQLDGEVQSMLQYFISFTIPTATEVGNRASDEFERGQYLPAIKEVVDGCLFNEMHLLCLLTATAARMEHVSKLTVSERNSARRMMTRAIPHIRTYLGSLSAAAMDKQVILDIFYLSVCEWYMGYYPSALTHMRGAQNLLEALSLDSQFDAFIKETLCYNDVFLAIETGHRPICSLDWDREPLPSGRCLEISQALAAHTAQGRMGRGFLEPGQNHIFSFEMNLILCELMPWIDLGRYAWLTRTALARDSEWTCRKGQALLHRLLSISPPGPHADVHSPSEGMRQECVRLSLIILLSFVVTQMGWRSGKINALRLRKCLDAADQDDSWGSPALDDMRFWVLVSGALGISDEPELEKWYLDYAARVATRLGLKTRDDMCETLSTYLYSPRFQGDILMEIEARVTPAESSEPWTTSLSPISLAGTRRSSAIKQTFGFNLSSESGRLLCRNGHWEATSTLRCLAEFITDEDDFDGHTQLACPPQDFSMKPSG